jgi:hypothetical protein
LRRKGTSSTPAFFSIKRVLRLNAMALRRSAVTVCRQRQPYTRCENSQERIMRQQKRTFVKMPKA